MDDSQYDSSLGGTQDLPTQINVLKFTSARCKEIAAMRKHISTITGTKLAFQRLPKHMRRRAMSHNVKRVPRRLRQIHLSQMTKSGLASGQKRPSRKYRRRPRNLLEEYMRRKRRVRWLETHIWHAKRFHMVEKWGCKLGDRPCDKAFRACYRATTKHCLVQDLSYLRCVEVEGPMKVVVGKFKEMGEGSGLSIGAKAYISGKREGEMVFYKNCDRNRKAIGTVSFVWGPLSKKEWGRLWLWIHPAFYTELLSTLFESFQTVKCSTETSEELNDIKHTNQTTEVVITEFMSSFNRFRLIGPLAQSVLVNSLNLASVKSSSEWFSNYLNDSENRQIFADQIDYWKSIKNISNTSVLPPHIVLSLIVTDPRYNLPKTKLKALPESLSVDINQLCEMPSNVYSSPLWDRSIQSAVSKNKMSTTEIYEIRQQLLVPGTDVSDTGEAIPIILIQQPGAKSYPGYCGGWDVIVPPNWGHAFWMSFIMWGARAGGLRETKSMRFEMGLTDLLAPDTDAGKKEAEELGKACRERYFRLPPAKRTNYAKFAISSPLTFNWDLLVREWGGQENYCLMRNVGVLSELQAMLVSKKNANIPEIAANYLIPIKVKLLARGCPQQFAIICLPNKEDIKTEHSEPLAEDKNSEQRKLLKIQHIKLLKRLKKKRKISTDKDNFIAPAKLQQYRKNMEELWLPKPATIRHSCSREVIGFLTNAGFSFVHSKGFGVGFVTIKGLFALLSKKLGNVVLIRNNKSRQYRLGKLEISL